MRRLLIVLLLLVAVPAAAQTPTAQKKADIGKLLDALQAAPNEEAAAVVESKLTETWLNAGSPAVGLLMSKGLRELHAGNNSQAIEAFSDVVTLDPTLAEGYRYLALARFMAGDSRGAIEALALAVKQEPRDFLAYKSLTDISEQREDWKGAYDAWQKVLALDPKTPGGQERLKHLREKALGQET